MMSQHNIACFRIYFRKIQPILFRLHQEWFGLYFFPTQVFHLNFRVFLPLSSVGMHRLWSLIKVHLLFGWFHPRVLNQPYQRKIFIDLANDYFIVSSGNQSPNSGIFSCIVYFKFSPRLARWNKRCRDLVQLTCLWWHCPLNLRD
jgi:hypothetical protein